MYNTTLRAPHRGGTGDAEKAGPEGRKKQHTTDSPGKEIGANRTKTSTTPQPLGEELPRMKERVKDGGATPPTKTFRITHLNCANSRNALEELTLIRQREDILLTSEPPLVENIPPEISGYTKIHAEHNPENDIKPRICAYIRDNSIGYTTEYTSTATEIQMRILGRKLRGIYSQLKKPIHTIYDSMEDGEIRMGDYNATHPRWKKDDILTTAGNRLVRWMEDEGAEERGPQEATHNFGNKLDLIFTKDTPESTTRMFHNGRVEHSNHRCQSICIKVPRLSQTINNKMDYRRTNTADIGDMIIGRNYPKPKDATELSTQLEDIMNHLPKKQVRDRIHIPRQVLEKRRNLNKAIRSKKMGKKEIQTLRLEYRESIRKYGND